MPGTQRTPEEITSRGEDILGQRLRDMVEPEHDGEFLVIDIKSGAYEIDPNDIEATKCFFASYPSAVFYGLRISFPTAYRIGGRFEVTIQ